MVIRCKEKDSSSSKGWHFKSAASKRTYPDSGFLKYYITKLASVWIPIFKSIHMVPVKIPLQHHKLSPIHFNQETLGNLASSQTLWSAHLSRPVQCPQCLHLFDLGFKCWTCDLDNRRDLSTHAEMCMDLLKSNTARADHVPCHICHLAPREPSSPSPDIHDFLLDQAAKPQELVRTSWSRASYIVCMISTPPTRSKTFHQCCAWVCNERGLLDCKICRRSTWFVEEYCCSPLSIQLYVLAQRQRDGSRLTFGPRMWVGCDSIALSFKSRMWPRWAVMPCHIWYVAPGASPSPYAWSWHTCLIFHWSPT